MTKKRSYPPPSPTHFTSISPLKNHRIPPLGDGAPLHWKFSDAQTAQCQDQGYGSERSPEEEFAPPLANHDLDQSHHHLEAHSCYPFITPGKPPASALSPS